LWSFNLIGAQKRVRYLVLTCTRRTTIRGVLGHNAGSTYLYAMCTPRGTKHVHNTSPGTYQDLRYRKPCERKHNNQGSKPHNDTPYSTILCVCHLGGCVWEVPVIPLPGGRRESRCETDLRIVYPMLPGLNRCSGVGPLNMRSGPDLSWALRRGKGADSSQERSQAPLRRCNAHLPRRGSGPQGPTAGLRMRITINETENENENH
jgi:hypothetical protein